MARKYKSRVTTEKLDAKIEQQKETLEKAKARYEAEKDALAELVKMRNELRKEELMDAVINSSRSYEEILAFNPLCKKADFSQLNGDLSRKL